MAIALFAYTAAILEYVAAVYVSCEVIELWSKSSSSPPALVGSLFSFSFFFFF